MSKLLFFDLETTGVKFWRNGIHQIGMATKKQILESDELLQQKRRAYYLSDEGFEEYKKFLSDPDQKKFCFKGYYYVEVKEQDDKELLGAMGRVVYE